MAIQINMPKLGLSMKEGTVAKWLVREGDTVKKGAAIVEVLTDKITSEVEAPTDGVLLKVVAEKKTKLPVGGLLGIFGAAGEDISGLLSGAAQAEQQTSSDAVSKVKISPAARKLAEENNIDYKLVNGTGPEGRITKEDVQKIIEQGDGGVIDERPAAAVIPYEGMRRAIGDNMARSWAAAPKVTQHVGVDVLALQQLRATINSDLKEVDKISFTDLLVKAVGKALEIHPRINATLSGEEIRVLQSINIGVAVAVSDGLVVPVVKNANSKSVTQISNEIKELAKRARKNKLTPDEMTGGTFTVTNLGSYGSVDAFTPIINQPESAILGIARIIKRPVVVEDQIVVRPVMGLSFAFDHRVIDGAPAAEFLAALIRFIEQPHKMFI